MRSPVWLVPAHDGGDIDEITTFAGRRGVTGGGTGTVERGRGDSWIGMLRSMAVFQLLHTRFKGRICRQGM
jgi:hypothetical protein